MRRTSRFVPSWLIAPLAACAVLAIALAPAEAQLASSSWPKEHHDLRNTGQGTVSGPLTPTLKWLYRPEAGVTTSPTIGEDGTVYLAVGHKPLCGLDPDDATVKWCTPEPGSLALESSPTVAADGTIYFGERSNRLWAVAPDPGGQSATVKWKFKIEADGDILTAPAVSPSDGTVYTLCGCTTGSGMVFALDPDPTTAEGEEIWSTQLAGGIKHPDPAVNDVPGPRYGRVYVSNNRAHLFALDPADGSVIWSTTSLGLGVVPGDMRNYGSAPVIAADGATIFVGFSKALYAFRDDGATVSFLWKYTTKDTITSSPALATGGTLYIGDRSGELYSIRSADGSLRWSANLGAPIFTQPAIGANGKVYVGARNKMVAVNPGLTPTSRILWEYPLDGVNKRSSPAIGPDGTLYVGVKPRRLYAFKDP
jgi:outer membrane protein assembly factor BamB